MFPLSAFSIIGSFVGSLPETEEMMALVRAGKIDPIPVQTRPLVRRRKRWTICATAASRAAWC